MLAPSGVTHRRVTANGLRFHVAEMGQGPLVLLLHGFPEGWFSWRRHLPDLAAAGYRAVAPALREYGSTDRPRGVRAYRVGVLVEDVASLVEALGEREAAVVGHDWGGVVAWYVAMHRPERVRALAVLNAPYPAAYRREWRRLSSQPLRSWYALAFQVPVLPEALLRAGRMAVLRRVWRGGPACSEEEVEAYARAFAAPGALTAAINYYRAAARFPRPATRPVARPALVLWGERDRYLVPALAEGLEPWVPDLRVERFPEASHWLQHDAPEAVSARLVAFLNALG